MRRFFYPIKDATIYQEVPNRQAGLDEVLEVGKSDNGVYSVRSLLGFDITPISASVASGIISPAASYDLTLFLANATKMQLYQTVNVHQISASWIEGSGYFYQDMRESTDGATWKYRETGSQWASVTSSISGGADYATPSSSTQTTEPIADLTFNVTNFISSWISGSFPNYGFLVKFPNSDERLSTNTGMLKFFSRNTHTVFSPVLVAKWDNSVYQTGSWTSASSDALTVFPINLRPEYKQGELARIDLVARELYPMKTFTTQFEAWKNRYLPRTSYYSVVDVQSQEVIIPFDDNSKISVDSDGNYIMFTIDKMFPKRYYKLMLKVVFPDGHQYTFDEHNNFTVTL